MFLKNKEMQVIDNNSKIYDILLTLALTSILRFSLKRDFLVIAAIYIVQNTTSKSSEE